jgi:hypothetical protein
MLAHRRRDFYWETSPVRRKSDFLECECVGVGVYLYFVSIGKRLEAMV